MAIDELISNPDESKTEIVFSKKYLPHGKVSDILRFQLDLALADYRTAVNTLERMSSDRLVEFKFKNEDALIKDVYIVGGLLWGRNDSDIDLYLQIYNTDIQSEHALKVMHFKSFCENKPKPEWVDIYLGKGLPSQDNFLGKPNYKITKQIKDVLIKYQLLKNSKKRFL